MNCIDVAGHLAILLQLTGGLGLAEVDQSRIIAPQHDVTALGNTRHQH
jgi:hypothetical protein